MLRPIALALAGAALLLSCADPVDKAAKKRIFSPEDPPKVVASAAEALAPAELDGAQAARRVLSIGAAEATERIGPHRYSASLSFAWSGKNGSVELKETRALTAGPGGVNGDFHAVLTNSGDQGLEVLRVGGTVYARSRYGKYRQRLRDRGMAEREREEVHGALRDVNALFEHRLALSNAAPAEYQGRKAWRYAAKLGPEVAGAEVALPPVPQPKDGVDPSTRRRRAFDERRRPASLEGSLVVDEQTGVVLSARLDGRMKVPDAPDLPGAELRISLASSLSDIGVDPRLQAPKEFVPDADKPQGIADALDRFGIPRGDKADAGTAPEEEPDDSP